MDEIKTAVGAVCAVSAVRCIIGTIVSPSKLKGQVLIILDLLTASVMIAVFTRGCSEFQLPEIGSYEFSITDSSMDGTYRNALEAETEQNIAEVLMQQVAGAGISCEKLETDVNIFQDGSISINRVTVISENFEAAAEIIRNCLGEETEVVNGAWQEFF